MIVRRLGYADSVIIGSADVVALVIQAVGGGIPSSTDTPFGVVVGPNIMLGEIVLQFVAMILYVIIAGDFFYHALHDSYHSRWRGKE